MCLFKVTNFKLRGETEFPHIVAKRRGEGGGGKEVICLHYQGMSNTADIYIPCFK